MNLSLSQQIQSCVNSGFYHLRSALKLSRQNYREKPVGDLNFFEPSLRSRVASLKQNYKVSFEDHLREVYTRESYHYLDLLDRLKKKSSWVLPQNPVVLDVGSSNFYYARVLNAFFRPKKLTGLEIDAYRFYANFHTPYSYAQYYIQGLENTDYQTGKFENYQESCDVLTFFYPFVLVDELINWALPAKFFKPQSIFNHAASLLNPGGTLVMFNLGDDEGSVGKSLMKKTGLVLQGSEVFSQGLKKYDYRLWGSLWKKGE